MSDMEEVEGPAGPVAPRRVIGTPPPTPRLLGSGGGGWRRGCGHGTEVEPAEERLPEESDYPAHAKNAEKIVAVCFLLAFIAGCGFIAAYIGLEVGSVDSVLRSNLALGLALSVALLGLGFGALIWVRQLMPDVEIVEERHRAALDRCRAGGVRRVLRRGHGREPVRQAAHRPAHADARHATAGRHPDRGAP